MVRIRLKRTGSLNAACFRIVVMDQRSSRDGRAIEELGYYNPRTKEEKINLERLAYWKSVGASSTDAVRKPALSKKAKAKLEAEAKAKAEAEAAAKAEAEAAAAAAAEAPAEEAPAEA